MEVDYFILRDKRVLVVEDNHINQKVMEKTLEKVGMIVEIARNGKEAIDKLQRQRYDVVLMDYHMPILDGIEATLKIRNELCLTVPIIATTASDAGDERKLRAAGMDDYLAKPFIKEVLYRKLMNLI